MDEFYILKEEMKQKKKWAVVGVTENPDKFGYKIWKRLKEHGYTAYGVNPRYSEIEDEKIYSSLTDLPEEVEVVDMVVNPTLSLGFLDQIAQTNIKYVWFQPGTLDEAVLEKAEAMGLKFVYHECIYAELAR